MTKKEIEKRFSKIQNKMNELNELLDGESYLFESGILDKKSMVDGVELPKKKKDKKIFFKEKAKTMFPKLVNQIEQLDVALKGIGIYLDNTMSNLEEQDDKLSEIENLQEEIDDRKRELDF